jgi:hypothetical protein
LHGAIRPRARERRIEQLVGAIRAKTIGKAPFEIVP